MDATDSKPMDLALAADDWPEPHMEPTAGDTVAAMVTPADVQEARAIGSGRIHLVDGRDGPVIPAEASTEIGADDYDGRRVFEGAGIAVLLLLAGVGLGMLARVVTGVWR